MSIEPHIPEDWTDAQQWAWEEIRAGRIADFNIRFVNELDPKKSDGWDDEQKDRRLSQAFLLTILTAESFCCVTPFKGVRIKGAYFEEKVDLQHARLKRQLWLQNCRFNDKINLMNLHVNGWFSLDGSWLGKSIDITGSVFDSLFSLVQINTIGPVDLTAAKIGGNLNMDGSTFDDKLNIEGTEIGQHLFMCNIATFGEVDLTAAKIGGNLNMSGSTFDNKLIMNGTEIGKHLLMNNKATFREVDLTCAKISDQLCMDGSIFDSTLYMNGTRIGESLFMNNKAIFRKVDLTAAKIGSQLYMKGSTFDDKLIMNGTEIGGFLLMSNKATFKEVNLTAAKIGGNLNMDNSTFDGMLIMEGAEIGQSFYARSTTFSTDNKIILHFAKIGSSLDLSEATIGAIDLTGTTISGELRLSSAQYLTPTKWVGNSNMVLRNTNVGAIQDAGDNMVSWPKNLELEGFTYRQLGGLGATGSTDISNRDSEWYIKWLKRDKTFSPQPYENLANVLRGLGYPAKANSILYAARERTRYELRKRRKSKPHECLRWIGMTLLKYTIGYGLGTGYFRVLWWYGILTLIGFIVLMCSIEKCNCNWDLFKMFFASLDLVIPIVKLNEEHEEIIFGICSRWTIMYFYIQKLIGYVLGGFLAGGLAGLTQKS